MTKPKLYYAHITRRHTHCYINSSTQYKGMYTSCSYHSLFARQWIYKHHDLELRSKDMYEYSMQWRDELKEQSVNITYLTSSDCQSSHANAFSFF